MSDLEKYAKYLEYDEEQWETVSDVKAWHILNALVKELLVMEDRVKVLNAAFENIKTRVLPIFDKEHTNVVQIGDVLLAKCNGTSVAYKQVLDRLVALRPKLALLVEKLTEKHTSHKPSIRKATVEWKPSGFPKPKTKLHRIKLKQAVAAGGGEE